MLKKIDLLLHQLHWLRKGALVVVATPTVLPGPGWLNSLRLAEIDAETWEGPIKHKNALNKNVKEEWLLLNGRSLYKDGGKMDFSIYRKKTHCSYF